MIITVPFTSGSILAADLGLSPDTVRTCGCVCRDGSILSWYNALDHGWRWKSYCIKAVVTGYIGK